MHHRCVPATAAAAALFLAVSLAACSTGSDEADGPPTPLTGAAEWGLTAPVATVTAVDGLTNWSENGITYVASVDPGTGALDVHHLRWDGTEAWQATVSPPTDAAAQDYSPHLSWDDALGVVAYWFTLSDQDTGPSTLDSPVHWFATATGEGGEILFTPTVDGGRPRPDKTLIGIIEVVDDADGTVHGVSVTYLQEDLTPTTVTAQGAAANRYGTYSIHQLGGVLLFSDGTALIASGTVLTESLTRPWDVVTHGSEILLVEGATSTVSRISQGALEPLGAPACSLTRREKVWRYNMTGGTIIGNLIVPAQGEAYCLDKVLAGTNLVPTSVLPSGHVLLEEVLPEDEASASTTPEAAEATGTASPEPTGDPTGDSAATQEHAFSVYSPGSGTVTALGERVRMTFRGGCAVLTEHHEAEGTTTYTLYRADTLDLGGL